MLGLFSGTPAHPLAAAKDARLIAAELAQLPPAKALGEAGGWFESLASSDGLSPHLRLERIVELAAASLPHARRQLREFMAAPLAARAQEQQQWRLNHDYWRTLTEALQRCLTDGDAGTKAADALRPRLAQLLTALLTAHGGQARWQRLRYSLLDDAHWGVLGQVYLRSLRDGVADVEIQALDAIEGQSTPAREYLRLLLLHIAAPHSLPPAEIGLTERLVARFLPGFALSANMVPGATFWIDASRPMPPSRLTQPPPPAAGVRFIAPGTVLSEVLQLRQTVAATPVLGNDLSLGGLYSKEEVLHVLDHLALCWSPTPPVRRNMRHRVASQVSVIVGLSTLCQYAAGKGNGLDGIVTWQVEDISQGGMSVRLPLLNNQAIKVGALIGFQPEGSSQWHVGAIRRFARANEIQGAAGIETLTKTPRAVAVMDNGLETELILLDALRDDSSVRVLLAPSYWEAGTTFATLLDGQPWRLHTDDVLESAGDWLIGRCIAERIAG
jgi:hypothetical protein